MSWFTDLFRPKAQTAAVVAGTRDFDPDAGVRRADRRISEAWQVWRDCGEIHSVTTKQARLVGRINWFLDVNGTRIGDDRAAEIFATAFGSASQQRSLRETAAIHWQVAGGYFLVRDLGTWKILPNPPESKHKKILDRADIVVKVENPDPQTPESRLDSPVLAALDIARELLLRRSQSRAAARSRTAQTDTLFYPIEGAGPNKEQFQQDLIDVMVAPLADERSTSSVVPNLVGFQGEWIKEIRTIPLAGDVDDKIDDKIDRLIHQLAIVLDVEPEMLLGMGDANHWAAWLISEDNWLSNVEPMASPIGEGFAQALELMLSGDTGAPTVDVEVTPDPSQLLKRRPTVDDALKAAELGIVDEEWAREQIGATEEDAGPGLVAMAEAKRATRAVESGDGPAAAEPRAVAAAAKDLPVDPIALAELDVATNEAMIDLVMDAAERALDRLGAQLRSRAQQSKLSLPDVPNLQLAVAYTQEIPNQDDTVADTAGRFEPQFNRIVSRAFARVQAAGVNIEPIPSDVADAFTAFKAEVATVVAARREDKPGNAEAWMGGMRVVSLLGGNPDPVTSPVVSAAGFQVNQAAIALGIRALEAIRGDYDLVADTWTWHHAYTGPHPHPVHRELEGREFRPGTSILVNGVNYFPQDHAGCLCAAYPVFTRRS